MGLFRKALIFLLAVCWLGCGPALATTRVALVIGNSAYKDVPRLGNPVNDAALLAAMFRKAGFDQVTTKLDVGMAEMQKALREFGAQARGADVAVIYFAGHGIELDGNNYLIPTDAILQTDAEVLDETVPLDRVLVAIEPAKQLRLVILDACRDNPFAQTMKRTLASRGIGRGLAKVEPNNPNTVIAFAAKAGSTASDGDARNSPFAVALVNHLATPGLDLRKAFGYVRDDVLKQTDNKQEPYIYGSLGGDDFPLVPKPLVTKPDAAPVVDPPSVATGPQANPDEPVRKDYEFALQVGTRDGWNAFLEKYPVGFYANLAKAQLNKIAAEEARAAAAEKARMAEQEKARLAAEGARQAEQVKAAAAALSAEEARLAAEKAKRIEQAKADAGEQARAAAEKDAAAKAASAEPAVMPPSNAPPADGERLASLSPATVDTKATQADLPKALQTELKRVGCFAAAVEGDWNAASQRSLSLFNKYAGTKFDVKLASMDALDGVKAKPSRVCPLTCEHGYKVDGNACEKITCKAGYRINDDNECERVRDKKPVASREDKPEAPKAPAAPAASQPKTASPAVNCSYARCLDVCNKGGANGCSSWCTNALTERVRGGVCHSF